MIQQSFLPVLTTDLRILGYIPVTPTTYTGAETSVTVSSVVIPTKKFTYTNREFIAVEFLGVEISAAQERAGSWNVFPGFIFISDDTPIDKWMMTGSLVVPANRSKGNMATFLSSKAFS